MNKDIDDILQQFGVEKLKRLLDKYGNELEEKPAAPTNSEPKRWNAFRDEYEQFVKGTFSASYLASIKVSNQHFEDHFGKTLILQELGLQASENYIISLQEKVKKGYRVYYRNIKAAFNKALSWGYIDKNPFVKVKLPRKQDLKPLFMTIAELELVTAKITHIVLRDIAIFGFYTGCRLNKIVSLTWNNVDLEKRILTIGDESFFTKSRKQRVIPMCDEITALLTRRQAAHAARINASTEKILRLQDYVFVNRNGCMISKDYASRRFKRACTKAGVNKGFHFHTLRHSFASNLVQLGVPLYSVKELLGHSSIITTQIYAHMNMNSLKDAVSVFNQPPKSEEPKSDLRFMNGKDGNNG